MRACSPHNQLGTTMPVCERVKAYNERSFCVKYHDQGVQTSFYESTPSAQDPMGNKISPVVPEDPGNARANIPDASKECDHRDTNGYSRVLFNPGNARANIPDASKEQDQSSTSGYSRVPFKHIPGTESVWRVASSNRFKTTEPHIYSPHFQCTP